MSAAPRSRLNQGFGYLEVLAIAAVLVILVVVVVVVGRLGRKQQAAEPCIDQLKAVGQVYAMYTSDNDGWPVTGGLIAGDDFQNLKIPRSCPLNPKGRYRDMVEVSVLSARMKKSSKFPDGSPIPAFDPAVDVLARCLEHGYDGFDRGPRDGFQITESTTGRVLGVLEDTSVHQVFPVSCWEFESVPKDLLPRFERQWRNCDGRASR